MCVRVTEADGWVRVDRFHVQPTLAGLRSLIARLAEDAGQNFDTPMARISSSPGQVMHCTPGAVVVADRPVDQVQPGKNRDGALRID